VKSREIIEEKYIKVTVVITRNIIERKSENAQLVE
jgi:hypothetical protein